MILNVKNLTHGFGDRAIFDNVSFRLLKGEHIGLIGANGEGKSTFMNIITGKLTPCGRYFLLSLAEVLHSRHQYMPQF